MSSMRPDMQMKIAGETDFFYAPLANRLGLYNVKIELENLSFRYRCPHEYEYIARLIQQDKDTQEERLASFINKIRTILKENLYFFLTSSSCHPIFFVKEFGYHTKKRERGRRYIYNNV